MKINYRVGKRTDSHINSHINRKKRKKKHTIKEVYEVIITYAYKNIKKKRKAHNRWL